MIVHVNLHNFRLSGRHHQTVQQGFVVHISVLGRVCSDAEFPFFASSVLRAVGVPPTQNMILSVIAKAGIVTSGKYLRSRSPPNVTFSEYKFSRGELNSIGSSSTALDSLGCSLSAEIGMTLLTDIGAVSGFSTVCVAGGRAVFSCFGGSGMTGFTSGGVGTGDVLGVTLDATGTEDLAVPELASAVLAV